MESVAGRRLHILTKAAAGNIVPLKAYLCELRGSEREEKTEHTNRSALEGLLQDFAAQDSGAHTRDKIVVRHESKCKRHPARRRSSETT